VFATKFLTAVSVGCLVGIHRS